MTDIAVWLRRYAVNEKRMDDAADEIERLRYALTYSDRVGQEQRDDLKIAVAEIERLRERLGHAWNTADTCDAERHEARNEARGGGAMTDIVERLRAGEPCQPHDDLCRIMEARSGCTCAEAADEIEMLRAVTSKCADAQVDGTPTHVTRNEALEEAALVADGKAAMAVDFAPHIGRAAKEIAAAVRALKQNKPG